MQALKAQAFYISWLINMEKLPFLKSPAFEYRIVLESVAYNFSFIWNTRGEYWTMGIRDDQNVNLVDSIKIVLDTELIEQFVDRDLPSGKMYALDTSGNKSNIAYDDMTNDRVGLYYLSEGEVLEDFLNV